MKKNMGTTDKLIRVFIAIVIAILYATETITGTLAIVLGAFAIIFAFTSLVSFCPIYSPFGINTIKKKHD